ncbi:MAG TPA: 23S rRNA (pseudouridine(1915)-N(3))-methyltransferase RlmH [Candidatus Acidoferrales bacterium]|nr:23S rRNA (pseudouridine(1915)-N(3))-methyltransferase RlmH [Candidatus Acidoferrales bacterium]
MKYRLIAVGRLREPYLVQARDDFRTRFRRYESLEEIEIAAARGDDPVRAMREESARIAGHLMPSDRVWLLERTGTELSSPELSRRLSALADSGVSRLSLVVAGTYGADPALIERADFSWSLGRLTFLHEWARAIVLEQLYRAAKIARNEPYHH